MPTVLLVLKTPKLPSQVRLQQDWWNKPHLTAPWPLPFQKCTSFKRTFSGFLWAFLLVWPICLHTQEASLNHMPWSLSGIWALAICWILPSSSSIFLPWSPCSLCQGSVLPTSHPTPEQQTSSSYRTEKYTAGVRTKRNHLSVHGECSNCIFFNKFYFNTITDKA